MADVAYLSDSVQELGEDSCSDLPCPASAATCPPDINKVYFLIGAHTSLQ
jgi:hypothetical protein